MVETERKFRQVGELKKGEVVLIRYHRGPIPAVVDEVDGPKVLVNVGGIYTFLNGNERIEVAAQDKQEELAAQIAAREEEVREAVKRATGPLVELLKNKQTFWEWIRENPLRLFG